MKWHWMMASVVGLSLTGCFSEKPTQSDATTKPLTVTAAE